MKFVGSINSTEVHCSQKKSTLTAKKKRIRTRVLRATIAWFYAQNTNAETQKPNRNYVYKEAPIYKHVIMVCTKHVIIMYINRHPVSPLYRAV